MRDLKDKVAWITGAGTGIGEAGAEALAAAGMKVVLSGSRTEPLEAAAARIGPAASVAGLDVSDRDAVAEVASRILADHGRVDVLVNSAGINVKERNWHNVSLDDWDRIIRIDLDGAFYCAKAVLPTMIDQGDGLIINISSWAGRYVSVVTGTRLYSRQTRHERHERKPEHGTRHSWHPRLRDLPRRGGDADPGQPACAGHR